MTYFGIVAKIIEKGSLLKELFDKIWEKTIILGVNKELFQQRAPELDVNSLISYLF